MTARKSHAEPYAYVTRRKQQRWPFVKTVFQLSVPKMPDGTSYDGEFNTRKEVTRFITSHLPGKRVRWDI